MKSPSRSVATVLAAVTLFASPAALAQPEGSATPAPEAPKTDAAKGDSKEAEQHFLRGRQLFDEGDYQLALVEFNRAYELSPNYRVLFNIAQINIQLFNYAAARTALEKYLRDGAADIAPPRKAQAERDLEMLKTRTAHLTITSTPPADITIDDAPAAFAQPVLVNAGQRKVVVTKPGFVSQTRFVTLAGGDAQTLGVELIAEAEKPTGPKVGKTMKKNYTPAIIGWVATGVCTVGAVAFGAIYLGKESDLDALRDPTRSRVVPEGRDDSQAAATRMAVVADVFGLLAIGAAAVSLYLTIKPPQQEAVTVGKIRMTPNGAAFTF